MKIMSLTLSRYAKRLLLPAVLFISQLANSQPGTLTVDDRSALVNVYPSESWDYSIITRYNVADLYIKAGFSPLDAAQYDDFFSTTSSKTQVSTNTHTENVFVAVKMFSNGKTIGTYQHFMNGSKVLLPTDVISNAIYFKDANQVEYHSRELASAISQELATKGISSVGIMYDNGNMCDFVISMTDGSPLTAEFTSTFHMAGTFNPSNYNIKFYPNHDLALTTTGTNGNVKDRLSIFPLNDLSPPTSIANLTGGNVPVSPAPGAGYINITTGTDANGRDITIGQKNGKWYNIDTGMELR